MPALVHMPADSTAALCFGKLPSRGDFIRHRIGGSGSGLQAFDAWVQRGLVQARQSFGAAFDSVFDAAPAYLFVMDPPKGEDVLAGFLRPSRDSAGRRYPLLVAVSVPRGQVDGRRLPSWPVRYQSFFAKAASIASNVADGDLGNDRIPERLAELRDMFDHMPFLVDYEYRLRQAPVWPLWRRTWGAAEDGRKYVLLKNLIKVFETTQGLRLRVPLGFPFPSQADSLDASFWLEACWHLNGKPPGEPAYFWPVADEVGSLVLALSSPPPALLTHLVTYKGNDEACLFLDDPDGQPTANAALALSDKHSALLEDETLSFRSFIDRL